MGGRARGVVIAGLLLGSLVSVPAGAVTLRYALIVGNNVGWDPASPPLPPLLHAEREATRLRDQLARYGNFDRRSGRTQLLLGATRAQVMRAVRRIARQMATDRKTLGKVDTLFLFYFTGHGLRGRLLMPDGPWTGDDLAKVFRAVDADLTLGVFDACYSGSLDGAALEAKGIKSTPGLNIFRTLPKDVLSARGRMWFVSSGPQEASYEDPSHGGLFTHFFIEGLRRARRDGPAITLERIWHYAHSRTVAYTTARGRRQTPRQLITALTKTGPLYFSYPVRRSATLEVSKSVHGRFLLTYSSGQLTQVIDKEQGRSLTLAVYPGKARLVRVSPAGAILGAETIVLKANGRVVLRANPDPSPRLTIGRSRADLWKKGFGDQTLAATQVESAPSVALGVAYAFTPSPATSLGPEHRVSLLGRLDSGGFLAEIGIGYGAARQTFETWGYRGHALIGGVRAGYGWDLGPVRLGLSGAVDGGALWQRYDDGTTRRGFHVGIGGTVDVVYPTSGRVAGVLRLDLAAQLATGAADEEGAAWSLSGGAGLGVLFRVF